MRAHAGPMRSSRRRWAVAVMVARRPGEPVVEPKLVESLSASRLAGARRRPKADRHPPGAIGRATPHVPSRVGGHAARPRAVLGAHPGGPTSLRGQPAPWKGRLSTVPGRGRCCGQWLSRTRQKIMACALWPASRQSDAYTSPCICGEPSNLTRPIVPAPDEVGAPPGGGGRSVASLEGAWPRVAVPVTSRIRPRSTGMPANSVPPF